MSGEKLKLARNVRIARDHWDVPVRVRLRPYLRFCRQIDGELEELVARWIHTMAPNSRSSRRRRP